MHSAEQLSRNLDRCVSQFIAGLSTKPGLTLLIDEPENFIGLSEIQPWLIALYGACGTQVTQTIIASHHPEVIDYFGADSGMLLSRDGKGPTHIEPLAEKVRDLSDNGFLRLSEIVAHGLEH